MIVARMSHRKWRETEQQLIWWPDRALPGCSLVYLHFQCNVLATITVQTSPGEKKISHLPGGSLLDKVVVAEENLRLSGSRREIWRAEWKEFLGGRESEIEMHKKLTSCPSAAPLWMHEENQKKWERRKDGCIYIRVHNEENPLQTMRKALSLIWTLLGRMYSDV